MLTRDELRAVHLILNADCNAWGRPNTPKALGVFLFCYQECNRVTTDPPTVYRVIDLIRHEPDAQKIVLTGGGPVMPDSPYLFRVWILADGDFTVDLDNVAAPQNSAFGNVLTYGLEPLLRHAFTFRESRSLCQVDHDKFLF